MSWAASVLERNLLTGEVDGALEDQGGVYAMVGATGVGKTTRRPRSPPPSPPSHGAGNLGLITLDAYRVGAARAAARLRPHPRRAGAHAHDRASLEDLLELLAGKMVLIDTAGMAQRDSRTRELLDMLQHRAIKRLLVVNAASQGETIEDVLVAYRAACLRRRGALQDRRGRQARPALDALIRHKLKVVGVANGQRVPEDWHRLSAQCADAPRAARRRQLGLQARFRRRQPDLRGAQERPAAGRGGALSRTQNHRQRFHRSRPTMRDRFQAPAAGPGRWPALAVCPQARADGSVVSNLHVAAAA